MAEIEVFFTIKTSRFVSPETDKRDVICLPSNVFLVKFFLILVAILHASGAIEISPSRA